MQIEVGQVLDLEVGRLGINGEGVGHFQGYTIFIDGALPGEVVRVRLEEKHKSYGKGGILKHLVSSSERIQPPCPLFGKCGGCQLMHLSYSQQLIAKWQRVVDALERIGKFSQVDVSPCIPAEKPLSYRNKIQLPVISSPVRLGLYAKNSHDLVAIDGCQIHCDLGEKALTSIRSILQETSIKEGELKHLLIKTAIYTREILIVFVTKAALPWVSSVAERIRSQVPEVKGIVQNINRGIGNTVLGRDFSIVAGQGYIEERLCGMIFKISPASFFQVNPAQAENLYEQALEFCSLTGREIVLDAYCGVGTLSLILARRAGRVIGIECVADAIADAKENAKRNGISNVQFVCDKAEEYLFNLEQVDVAVLNPPRKGCDKLLLEKLTDLGVDRIVYISCDPATLARDLHFLSTRGYRVDKVQPFDMFPQTSHVECLVRLTFCGQSPSSLASNFD